MHETTPFTTIFDLARSGYKDWSLGAFGFAFIVIGLLMIIGPRLVKIQNYDLRSGWAKTRPYVFTGFAALLTAGMFFTAYAMPPSGHPRQSFSVGGVHFDYSGYIVTDAFVRVSDHELKNYRSPAFGVKTSRSSSIPVSFPPELILGFMVLAALSLFELGSSSALWLPYLRFSIAVRQFELKSLNVFAPTDPEAKFETENLKMSADENIIWVRARGAAFLKLAYVFGKITLSEGDRHVEKAEIALLPMSILAPFLGLGAFCYFAMTNMPMKTAPPPAIFALAAAFFVGVTFLQFRANMNRIETLIREQLTAK